MGAWRRRKVLAAAAASVAAIGIAAQTRTRPRVAMLSGAREADTAHLVEAMLAELRSLGYEDGRTMDFDARYADYSEARGERLAAEIAARKPAVIVANGRGIEMAVRLSPPLPVVFIHSGNPVDAGFVDSLPRPGRQATGISLMALDLIAKRIEFLRQMRPGLQRMALLASPEHAGQQRESLATFFLDRGIPSAAGYSAFPDSGHVMSYGPERKAVWRRTAHFVDRIIKGARPAELPVELPTVFELVINRRAANAMKLVVAPQLMVLADRVVG